MNKEELKESLLNTLNQYIKIIEKKENITFIEWIGNEIAGIAKFKNQNNKHLNIPLTDIIFTVHKNLKPQTLSNHYFHNYNYNISSKEDNYFSISLQQYNKGIRHKSN